MSRTPSEIIPLPGLEQSTIRTAVTGVVIKRTKHELEAPELYLYTPDDALDYSFTDGHLSLRESGITRYKHRFFGRTALNDYQRGQALLYVPPEYPVDYDIDTTVGDIIIKGILARTIKATTISGLLSLQNTRATAIDLKTDTSDIKLKTVSSETTAKLKTRSGEVMIPHSNALDWELRLKTGETMDSVSGNMDYKAGSFFDRIRHRT